LQPDLASHHHRRATGLGGLPFDQELRDRRRLDPLHLLELRSLRAVKQLAALAQNRQLGNASLEWNSVLFGQIDILVEMADVDVDQDEIGIENRPVLFIVKIDVEYLAIAAPVPTEIEQNASMGGCRALESGVDVGLRLRRVGINIAACGVCRARGERQHGPRANPGSNPLECLHRTEKSSIGHLSVCHKR